MKYTLGLRCGGLMEDPDWHIEYIASVEADDLNDAKDKWAEVTGHKGEFWDEKRKTYWGWEVVTC